MPELYQDPQVLAANPYFANFLHAYRQGVVTRPSTITGKKYPDVSRAYFNAVHAVLARDKSAANAAAELQDELVQITGLKAQPPSSGAALQVQPYLPPHQPTALDTKHIRTPSRATNRSSSDHS